MGSYEDFEAYNPRDKVQWYKRGAAKPYRRLLRGYLQDLAGDQESLYRQKAYRDIGQNQRQATDTVRRSTAGSLGVNNPTGLTSALEGQIALDAPYGAANLGAREAGRRAVMGTGRELEGSYQRGANLYSTYAGPALQQSALDLQLAALEAQQALNLAGIGGGGSAGGFLGGFLGGGGGGGGGFPGMGGGGGGGGFM